MQNKPIIDYRRVGAFRQEAGLDQIQREAYEQALKSTEVASRKHDVPSQGSIRKDPESAFKRVVEEAERIYDRGQELKNGSNDAHYESWLLAAKALDARGKTRQDFLEQAKEKSAEAGRLDAEDRRAKQERISYLDKAREAFSNAEIPDTVKNDLRKSNFKYRSLIPRQ